MQAGAVGFSQECRAAAALSQRLRPRPCDCEQCLEIGAALQALLAAAVEYRGIVFAKLGIDDDDDDEADEAGAIKLPVQRANGDIIVRPVQKSTLSHAHLQILSTRRNST